MDDGAQPGQQGTGGVVTTETALQLNHGVHGKVFDVELVQEASLGLGEPVGQLGNDIQDVLGSEGLSVGGNVVVVAGGGGAEGVLHSARY